MKNLLYIGNQLSQKGKTVTTIDTLSTLFRSVGYGVVTASKKRNKVLRMFDMLFCILKYRKQTDYVLIDTYSTSNFYYAYLVSQLCRLLKLKYIPILHGGNLPNRLKTHPKLSKAIFNHSYKNVAPSLYIQSNFEDLGYSNVVCIPNSIEIKNYPFKTRRFDKVKLLWVRSFSKIYNPILAVNILKALKEENIESKLCMAGPDNDGSLNEVINYAEKLNIDVAFTGKLTKQEWIKLSEAYNIFINTTNFDNMPVSVIEAMALGLPIVTTNVSGMPFLISNKQDGVLVNPNNVDAFVSAIKDMINNLEDTNLMIKNARKKVKQFDWETVKYKWIALLQ